MRLNFQLNPATRKRLRRFRRYRRAYVSAWLLAFVFLLALGADLLCNDKPLLVRFNGRTYFPILRYYSESEFLPEGKSTRPDYKALNASPGFADDGDNFMLFPPVPFGPNETIREESLKAKGHITVTCLPLPRAGNVDLTPALAIARSRAAGLFFGGGDAPRQGDALDARWPVDQKLRRALEARFRNEPAPALSKRLTATGSPRLKAEISLSAYTPRAQPPSTVRMTFRTPEDQLGERSIMTLDEELAPVGTLPPLWAAMASADQERIRESAATCREGVVDPIRVTARDQDFQVLFDNSVSWPHHPVSGHWLGIDSAGRDVLARVVHGLRVSLIFSILLVVSSMFIGILVGALQGFYGGITDIAGQRITEVWSAIPFLYVMILLGSIYGARFWLLLTCYAIFNWIGISYYMRAEFLRLRKQPFVDAARVLGVSSRKIMFRHILPNAITPIITFLPFYLVGAIASLAALDYLGFGLPPLTPSLGQLLHQAQANRSAWWLILYPSLTLFIVMLLGVFVGEGVREAYDPRPRIRME